MCIKISIYLVKYSWVSRESVNSASLFTLNISVCTMCHSLNANIRAVSLINLRNCSVPLKISVSYEKGKKKFWKCRNVNERRKNAINSKYLIGANLFACFFFFHSYYLIFIHMLVKFVGCMYIHLLNYSTYP